MISSKQKVMTILMKIATVMVMMAAIVVTMAIGMMAIGMVVVMEVMEAMEAMAAIDKQFHAFLQFLHSKKTATAHDGLSKRR